MKITEHIKKAKKPFVSFEILPPVKGQGIQALYEILDPLMEFKPPVINVTYHRAEYTFKKRTDGLLEKVEIRKRPGTVGICAAIINRYGVDATPHLTCGGFTKQETEDALIDLNYLGVDNILIIRGDPAKNEHVFIPEEKGHHYAIELLKQAINLNKGNFLEEGIKSEFNTNFSIGVAGYPEKHYEAPNKAVDLKFLKDKVDAGAEYIITQMFYDNKKYFDFVKDCRDLGINVPIIPGLKPITTIKQLNVLPRTFHVEIPVELYNAVEKCKNNEEARKVGTEWCIQQSKELLEFGAPCLHYYTMSRPQPILEIVRNVF